MSGGRVEFRQVWKKFHRGELHDSLRDLIPAAGRRLIGRGQVRDQLGRGDFWALRDLSFSVEPGTTLGIIGPNGAGKSTTLKILTRILRPNRGICEVQGRIGALIEVAAGFHPDLTGRENVFLQGSIMGMTSGEVRKKFDEIVEFSGVSDFIDTPVKRFSTGMNARLGFAIAAHLDPDVLVVDEVLAVGDFAFQERAFGRIKALAQSGIPVVVVSHQLDRIAELCEQAILLSHGEVLQQGSAKECIAAYVGGAASDGSPGDPDCPVRFESVRLEGAPRVRSGDRLRLRIRGQIEGPLPRDLEPVAVLVRALHTGEVLFATSTTRLDVELDVGPFEVWLDLQANLKPGNYVIETVAWDPRRNRHAAVGPATGLEITQGASFWGTAQMNPVMRLRDGAPAATEAAGSGAADLSAPPTPEA